jgi:hypothetical protein
VKKKKETDVQISIQGIETNKHTFVINDQPANEVGNKYMHDGNVFIIVENEKNSVHIDIDKNIFDSWIQAYLEGDFIRYRSGVIQGKLIKRQQKFIEVLQAKVNKLKEYQLQNSKK